jgi:hypothetical protein
MAPLPHTLTIILTAAGIMIAALSAGVGIYSVFFKKNNSKDIQMAQATVVGHDIQNSGGGVGQSIVNNGPGTGGSVVVQVPAGTSAIGTRVIQNGPGVGLSVTQNGPGVGFSSTVVVGPKQ